VCSTLALGARNAVVPLTGTVGFVNYLSKFLPRLSEVAQPLREMTSMEAKFIWSQQHERAFQEVRELVVKHPVLKKRSQCNVMRASMG